MDGHQLISPFSWNQGEPQRGHDWKISIKGPNVSFETFNVNLQVVASASLYFSKYALDDEEAYRESQDQEVVIDWCGLEENTHEKMITTFRLWLDLVYALVGCGDKVPGYILKHHFFSLYPLYAGCILQYFQCPSTLLMDKAKKKFLALSFKSLMQNFSGLHSHFGGDWMETQPAFLFYNNNGEP